MSVALCVSFLLTFLGRNYPQEGPHPREIYNCSQQLCLDAKTVLQTTYAII